MGAYGRTIAAAVTGGTASALGGGKFANGAVSAAFAHLFNTESGRNARATQLSESRRNLANCGLNQCPVSPSAPSGADVDVNIADAQSKKGDADWFYNQVRNKGPWDYKQQGSAYENFGNFNYGATGRAVGFPEGVLSRAAGWGQQQAGTSNPSWGSWYGGAPYGDDPADQVWIQRGIDYYNCGCDLP